MPLAHVCPVCGSQLARTRGVAGPAGCLRVVVCTCGFAAVRRKHPVVVRWRKFRSTTRAAAFLLFQTLLVFGLSVASAGFITWFESDLKFLDLSPHRFVGVMFGIPAPRPALVERWYDQGGVAFLIGFGLMSLAAGAWLRAALAHWRWPRPIFAWVVLVSVWVWFEALFWPLTWLDGRISGTRTDYSGPGVRSSLYMFEILAASVLVSFAASPVGAAISGVLASMHKRRFKRRLTRLRKARRGE